MEMNKFDTMLNLIKKGNGCLRSGNAYDTITFSGEGSKKNAELVYNQCTSLNINVYNLIHSLENGSFFNYR